MEDVSLFALLGLGFGLGLLHALDADHVMAVTGLACTRTNRLAGVTFCARWALGHGLSLLFIGGTVLLVGMAIPQQLSALAESLVGVMLIVIGLWVAWDLLRRRVHLHFHRHEGCPPHAHWHLRTEENSKSGTGLGHHHRHGAALVGSVHGIAGSAPLLALLPAVTSHSPWMGMLYLGVFGIGVFIAMLFCGGLMGIVFGWLQRYGDNLIGTLRGMVALGSMGFGAWLLWQ